MSLPFAAGFSQFEDGFWPQHPMRARFGGFFKLVNDHAVVEMAEPRWFLRYDGEYSGHYTSFTTTSDLLEQTAPIAAPLIS